MISKILLHLPSILIVLGPFLCTVGVFVKTYTKIIVLIGAMLSLTGGIWTNIDQLAKEKEYSKRLEDILYSTTGGPSAPAFTATIHNNEVTFNVVNFGPYPLYELSIRILELKREHAFMINPKDALVTAVKTEHSMGNIPKGTWWSLGSWQLPNSNVARYDFSSMARNGSWRHYFTFRKVNDKWTYAIKSQSITPQDPPEKWQWPEEVIPEDFPRNNKGEPLW